MLAELAQQILGRFGLQIDLLRVHNTNRRLLAVGRERLRRRDFEVLYRRRAECARAERVLREYGGGARELQRGCVLKRAPS